MNHRIWTNVFMVAVAAMMMGTQCKKTGIDTPMDPDPFPDTSGGGTSGQPGGVGDPEVPGFPAAPDCDPVQCNDRNPCNGEERCSGDQYDRCIPGPLPCGAGEVCMGPDQCTEGQDHDGDDTPCQDEAEGYECTPCIAGMDHDGDGSPCEVDCNDQDSSRHPGAKEVCEADQGRYRPANWTDEDCTVDLPYEFSAKGSVDQDGDGEVNAYCVNVGYSDSEIGQVRQGEDCDDDDDSINSNVADDICDRLDNDCDGVVDEGNGIDSPDKAFYADCDGDGWGAFNWLPVIECGSDDLLEAGPVGCPPGSTSATWTQTDSPLDCNDADINIGGRTCDPELVNHRDCTGSCGTSGLQAEHANSISHHVERCDRGSCQWGTCESFRSGFLFLEEDMWSEGLVDAAKIRASKGDSDLFGTYATLPAGDYTFTFYMLARPAETIRFTASELISKGGDANNPTDDNHTVLSSDTKSVDGGKGAGKSEDYMSFDFTVLDPCTVVRLFLSDDNGLGHDEEFIAYIFGVSRR